MCITNYLSLEKWQYLESLETVKKQRQTMQRLSLDNSTYNKLINHLDLLIDTEKQKLETGKQIIGLIQNQTSKDILIYRYIKLYDWYKIARIMRYSEKQIYRLHNIALTEFDRIETDLQLSKLYD